jgi:hypothetical protein
MLLFFWLIFWASAATATWTVQRSDIAASWDNATFECPVGCKAWVSLPDLDILAEFTCEDGQVRDSVDPFPVLALNPVRALIDPPLAEPSLNETYWVGTLGDGFYRPCTAASWPDQALLEGQIVDCESVLPWLCLCPRETPAPLEHEHTLMARDAPVDYAQGHVGFRDGKIWAFTSGMFYVHNASGAFVVSDPNSTQADYVELLYDDSSVALWMTLDSAVVLAENGPFLFDNQTLTLPFEGLWVVTIRGNSSVTECGARQNCVLYTERAQVQLGNGTLLFRAPRLTDRPTTTRAPLISPTEAPTHAPTTLAPTTLSPTQEPTTLAPTTLSPTYAPSLSPSASPSNSPTAMPTRLPTRLPTVRPTRGPTKLPSARPTANPSAMPTENPSASPTPDLTPAPTAQPTEQPSSQPTSLPTSAPTANPSALPTAAPTAQPTAAPTAPTTRSPTSAPSSPTHTVITRFAIATPQSLSLESAPLVLNSTVSFGLNAVDVDRALGKLTITGSGNHLFFVQINAAGAACFSVELWFGDVLVANAMRQVPTSGDMSATALRYYAAGSVAGDVYYVKGKNCGASGTITLHDDARTQICYVQRTADTHWATFSLTPGLVITSTVAVGTTLSNVVNPSAAFSINTATGVVTFNQAGIMEIGMMFTTQTNGFICNTLLRDQGSVVRAYAYTAYPSNGTSSMINRYSGSVSATNTMTLMGYAASGATCTLHPNATLLHGYVRFISETVLNNVGYTSFYAFSSSIAALPFHDSVSVGTGAATVNTGAGTLTLTSAGVYLAELCVAYRVANSAVSAILAFDITVAGVSVAYTRVTTVIAEVRYHVCISTVFVGSIGNVVSFRGITNSGSITPNQRDYMTMLKRLGTDVSYTVVPTRAPTSLAPTFLPTGSAPTLQPTFNPAPEPVTMFNTESGVYYPGDFGGVPFATPICVTRAAALSLTCARVNAMLSDGTNYISGLDVDYSPTFSASSPVVGPGGLEIAPTWTDFVAGTWTRKLDEGGLDAGFYFWSGKMSAPGDQCIGVDGPWTNPSLPGHYGHTSAFAIGLESIDAQGSYSCGLGAAGFICLCV